MTKLIEDINQLSLNSGQNKSNFYITCASFEPRSTTVASNFSDDFCSDVAIVYYNKELETHAPSKISEAKNQIESELDDHCDHIIFAEGSIEDPIDQLEELRKSLSEAEDYTGEIKSVTVDITTFNRESLLTLLNLINRWYANITIDVLYVSPEEYGGWLSRGHKKIRNVVGFTGIHDSDNSTALIVLSGFEKNRTYKIVEEIEPAVLYLGLGEEPTQEGFYEENKQSQEKIRNRQDTREFGFPTNDVGKCERVIDNIVSGNIDEHNIILAPMNTKLSTVGCWKAARGYDSLQIMYALPDQYNYENYSEGARCVYTDSFKSSSEEK